MKPIFRSTPRTHRARPQQHQEAQPDAQTAFFQPKLSINAPGDQYEREADAVADTVVNDTGKGQPAVQRMPISTVQRLATPEEEQMPATNDGRMAEDKKIQEKPMDGGRVQKMDAPKEEEEKPIQKAAAEEEEPVQKMDAPKEEEKPVQKAAAEEEEPVQAKAQPGASKASPDFSARLSARKGQGQPLPATARTQMEQGIGADFSRVRIHTDPEAAEMNKDIHAQAFTHGSDVYFNSGKFNPENTEGKRLLAHELTHVVQQGGGWMKIQRDNAGKFDGLSGNDQDSESLPSNTEQNVSAKPRKPNVKKLKKILEEKGKDVFFEELRRLSSQERSDVGLNEFVVQNLTGNDLWLAQNILKLGAESNWPIALKIERALTGLDDYLGLEAALLLIDSATRQEKLEIINNNTLVLKIKSILDFDNVHLLNTEIKSDVIRQMLATRIMSFSSLLSGGIREATEELLISSKEVDRNTAIQLLNGDILAYYVENLIQPEEDHAKFILSERKFDPTRINVYYEPPENTKLMFSDKDARGFQKLNTNKIFVKKAIGISEIRTTLVHETNHALNSQTFTEDASGVIERYKSEFRAFWVTLCSEFTDDDEFAEKLKNNILKEYKDIKKSYDKNPVVKEAIDNHTRPDGNITNR